MKCFNVSSNRINLFLVLVLVTAFKSCGNAQPAQALPATTIVHEVLSFQQSPCQEAWENRVSTLFKVVGNAGLPFLNWNRINIPIDPFIEQWYLSKIAENGGHLWGSYEELEADLVKANLQKGYRTDQGRSYKLPQGYEQDPCNAPPNGGQPAGQSVPVPTTEVNEELQLELAIQQTYTMFEAEVSRSGDQSAPVGVSVGSGSSGDGVLGAIVLPVLVLVALAFLASANRRRAHA